MRKLIGVCVGLLVCMPFAAFAQSAYTGINSQTDAESSTGGNSAPGGTSVSGAASASAEVHTTVNGGTLKSEVQTETNGIVHSESIEKVIPKNGHTEIQIATSSGNENVDVHAFFDESSGGIRSELSSFFNWFHVPSASTSIRVNAEPMASSSGLPGAHEDFFSSLWNYIRILFVRF